MHRTVTAKRVMGQVDEVAASLNTAPELISEERDKGARVSEKSRMAPRDLRRRSYSNGDTSIDQAIERYPTPIATGCSDG